MVLTDVKDVAPRGDGVEDAPSGGGGEDVVHDQKGTFFGHVYNPTIKFVD